MTSEECISDDSYCKDDDEPYIIVDHQDLGELQALPARFMNDPIIQKSTCYIAGPFYKYPFSTILAFVDRKQKEGCHTYRHLLPNGKMASYNYSYSRLCDKRLHRRILMSPLNLEYTDYTESFEWRRGDSLEHSAELA